MVEVIQQQARALGDPTRYEIFAYVMRAGRGVAVAELTEHLGLHHSAIRQHLTKLVEAGLLVEEVAAPRGRGRPPLTYTLDPTAESRWGAVSPYERLSLWLAECLRTGDAPREVGRRVGRRAAEDPDDPTCGPPADPVSALVAAMAHHGFEPALQTRGEAFEVTLNACPFASVASADPNTVCDLHRGMAEGIAEATGGLSIDTFVTDDPSRAKCRLRVSTDRLG